MAKLTPLLFAVYLLGRRGWRGLAGLVAGLAIAGVLLPAIALGPSTAFDAQRAWAGRVAAPAFRSPAPSTAPERERPGREHGISLRALVHRHLTWSQAASPRAAVS